MNNSTRNASPSELEITPTARALLVEVQAATDAGRVFPDFPSDDPRGDDIEELAAENLIEPVDSDNVDGGGWRAVAGESK
jgi:hypothetical protein